MQKSNSKVTIFFISIIITTQINAIIKKSLDFENNHDIISLTLYYRYIDSKIKDINVIIRALRMVYNIEYYR